MKKKELLLDFTSLLDVIMIILFLVIGNMNQASAQALEKSGDELAQASAQLEELKEERDELKAQIEELEKEDASDSAAQLAELQKKYNALQDDYDYLKIVSDYDANNKEVYEMAIRRTAKVTLICETSVSEETGHHQVKVDLYRDRGSQGSQSYVDSVVLEHDFDLSKEERDRFNAEQVLKMTKMFSGALRDDTHDMIWFSIQYAYDDSNFSNSDLRIIKEAIDNLERSFSKACYAEEIKIY